MSTTHHKPNAQHKALQLKIFQQKIVKPAKGRGSFARRNKHKDIHA